MDAYYFTFHSMTQAQTAAFVLQKHGFTAAFLRAPKAISTTGCGYAVQIGLTDAYGGIYVLRNAGVFPQKIFRIHRNGDTREVSM